MLSNMLATSNKRCALMVTLSLCSVASYSLFHPFVSVMIGTVCLVGSIIVLRAELRDR